MATNTKTAVIEILDPDAVDETRGLPKLFYVQFNPTQYDISKSVSYEETKSPGADLPILKFTSGETETLTLELMFDTTDHGMGADVLDVREYTRTLYQLTQVQPKTHAPPRIRFTWSTLSFVAVASDVKQSFTLFNPDGTPLRAKVSVTFKKIDKIEVDTDHEINLFGKVHHFTTKSYTNYQSPDRYRSHTVRAGETLPAIAAREYEDPRLWKVIADANADVIPDVRRLIPGTALLLPKLDAYGEVVG